MRILSVGEILWDVLPGGEHLGGAPFNFAAHAARLGHEVAFLSAVGDDERGRRAVERARALGLATDHIGVTGAAPTGSVDVSVDASGQPSYVIHRPAAYDFAELDEGQLRGLDAWRPDWLCFGTLHQMSEAARVLRRRLMEAIPRARVLYDVNLRRESYAAPLVNELLGLATAVKLNRDEMAELGRLLGLPGGEPEEFCRVNAARFGWEAVALTDGEQGCSLLVGDEFVQRPGYRVVVADTVGSGDAFAAAFLHGLGAGWPTARIADFSNRVGALVASRQGAIPDWSLAEVEELGGRGLTFA